MKKTGFTLIELLVVIAIIAILAAILFPVFARAREKARQSQCMSNLKNCAMAVRMYSSDYDERLPGGIPQGFGAAPPGGWPNSALVSGATDFCSWDFACGWAFESVAYIKNSQVLYCPNRSRIKLQDPTWYTAAFDVNFRATSYLLSECLVGASEAQIAHAANKVMLYEVVPYHHDQIVTVGMFVGGPSQLNKGGAPVMVAFADGHTKLVHLNQALGTNGICFGATGQMGTPAPGITASLFNNPMGIGYLGSQSSKWDLNGGWDPSSSPSFSCAANASPMGDSGRAGANF